MARGLILLADADDQAREAYTQRLQQDGYTVLSAKDGETIIRQLGFCRPNNVLLGNELSGISAKETCRRIRKAYGTSIPVMLFAKHPTLGDLHDMLDSGGNDYLLKNGSASVAGRVNNWHKHDLAKGMEARRRKAVKKVARKIAENENFADVVLGEDFLGAILKEPTVEPEPTASSAPAPKLPPKPVSPSDDDVKKLLSSMAVASGSPSASNKLEPDKADIDAFFSRMNEEKPAPKPKPGGKKRNSEQIWDR